jgi:hypothetical protein
LIWWKRLGRKALEGVAHLERWNRSVNAEWLSKMILLGEASLRQVLSNHVSHFHTERNHQGSAF